MISCFVSRLSTAGALTMRIFPFTASSSEFVQELCLKANCASSISYERIDISCLGNRMMLQLLSPVDRREEICMQPDSGG
jgi:hypothetical protein